MEYINYIKKYKLQILLFIVLFIVLLLLSAYIFKNKCNIYVTKDETFVENIDLQNKRKLFKYNFFLKNKILSSDFKEKVLKVIKE